MTSGEKVKSFVSAYLGPAGFEWAIPGLLGGTPRPGIFKDIEHDIKALERIGTSVLITLQDEWSPPTQKLQSMNIESIHMPIPDMGVPSLDNALALVDEVERRIKLDGTAVYHCKGGRGRTGTLLACHFVRRGMTGEEAINKTRERNPNWIESDAQLAFIHQFYDTISK